VSVDRKASELVALIADLLGISTFVAAVVAIALGSFGEPPAAVLFTLGLVGLASLLSGIVGPRLDKNASFRSGRYTTYNVLVACGIGLFLGTVLLYIWALRNPDSQTETCASLRHGTQLPLDLVASDDGDRLIARLPAEATKVFICIPDASPRHAKGPSSPRFVSNP
jgi:hypothetical protein